MRGPTLAIALALLALAACGSDATQQARVECGVPELAVASALPFAWIEVRGLPEGFGPAAAEVGLPDGSASVLAPVATGRGGFAVLRVPVHPSFRIGGGEASVRIYSDAASCDPVPLTIAALEPVPGAMADATGELRVALDEILAPTAADGRTADLTELTASGGEMPLLAIPALWTLPDLERLERLVAGDSVATESPEDAEMLDAIAGRLELPRRMAEFRSVMLVVRELTDDLSVAVPPPGEVRVSRGPDSASPFRFASHAPAPPARVGSRPTTPGSACQEDRDNLFDIAEPEKLDNLMRAQDRAARFLAGADDEDGGSATGTLFGDIGEVMSLVQYLGKPARIVAEAWEAFSTVALNSADAYASLLPGDMELTVTADPAEFEEDSEKTGTWTASAVATSDGMKLGERAIQNVIDEIVEKSAGKVLGMNNFSPAEGGAVGEMDDLMGESDWADHYEKFAEDTGGAVDDALFKDRVTDRAKQEVGEILERMGAKEVADGFEIPGGCWTLEDMSASDASAGAAADDGAETDEGDAGDEAPTADGSPPPLVIGKLSGGAVEYVDDGSPAPREYEPVEVGTSRLEVRTAEGYRKTMASAGGLSIGATYAFGGDQYTAVTRITVDPIEIVVNPAIKKVEPGEKVEFDAVVRNAVDTRVDWSSSAGTITDEVDRGGGAHKANLITPEDPSVYPLTVEVESLSRSGAREDGTPVRKGTAHVQLADPVIDIQPAGGCVSAGEERQFTAQVLGVGDDQQNVGWSVRGGPGRIDSRGLFRARGGEGTVTIEAAWAEDPEVTAEVDVRVEDECSFITFSVSGDAGGRQDAGLGVRGAVGTDQSRHPQLEPGYCSVWIHTDVQTGSPQPSISFSGMVRDGLRSENYLIGDDQTIKTWGDERRSPGVFFAALGTESDGPIGESKQARHFVSQGGTLSIEIDGNRIKGTFSVQFKEQPPFFDYPRQQMAHATGHFEGVLTTEGWPYLCPLPDDQ
ncbi:MAG: Ig-like domain-containing protein [Gemmatimonadota bacterium]